MKFHELKTIPPYFQELITRKKQFEIRFNDRDFQVNDVLLLKEYIPKSNNYTGRKIKKQIRYILTDDAPGLQPGYCILGLSDCISYFGNVKSKFYCHGS